MLRQTILAIAVLGIVFMIGTALAQDDDTKNGGVGVVTSGCWQGEVFNDAQGSGTVSFLFEVSKNKIVKSGSMYLISYDEGLMELGAVSGKVTATHFTFKAKAIGNQGSKCKISGKVSAVQGENFLDGSYRYTGKCTEIRGPFNPFTGGSIGKLEFVGPSCP